MLIIKNVDLSYSLPKLYNELEFDTVDTMAKKAACKVVYQAISNRGPDNLNSLFTVHDPNRTLCSSSSLCVEIPQTNTNFGENNFAVSGGQIWNCVPENIKQAASTESFKAQIKKYPGFG